MIEYYFTKIDLLSSQLSDYLAQVFNFPAAKTTELLTTRFALLKDNLIVVYEYPYVDRLYRDTYYNYFSTKHKPYFRNCVRISLFRSDFDVEKLKTFQSVKSDDCLGFICIRPKFPNIFGRGLLSPEAFKENDFETCVMETNASIKGARFKIKGFPFASQDTEYTVCAETAIWETVEYFGTKYPEYRTILPSEIMKILSKFSIQRDIPSHGLTSNQISYVLKQLGYDVRIYHRESYKSDTPKYSEFYKILLRYVDSAIPVIAILKNKNGGPGHSVLYIGHKIPKIDENLKNDPKDGIFEYAQLIDRYVICDDNRLIYQFANFTVHGEDEGYRYSSYYPDSGGKIFELEAIIVPLPRRVYLEASQAKKFISTIVALPKIGINVSDESILKVFFTTSRSFKNWIAKNDMIDLRIKEIVVGISMPRFIWVGELSTFRLLKNGISTGLVVIDATHPQATIKDSLLFIWTSDVMWYHDNKDSFRTLKESIKAEFTTFQNFK